MSENMRGQIHMNYSPFTEIYDLYAFAEEMVGKPVTIEGVVVGKITSAEVCGNYVKWEAMPFHSSNRRAKQ